MSQTVGLAMIVRDAAATLSRCLESVACGVDEIVVVDTGSVDETRAIAQRFTPQVFAFDWCDDFGTARQWAFDRVRSDWVIWLDADDRVEGADAIRSVANECPADVGEVHWKYIAEVDRQGHSRREFWRERCVRNDGSYRWRGRVHEVLMTDTPRLAVYSATPVVFHERDPRSDRDPARNLRILRDEYQRAGTAPEARLLLYLAAEHAALGDVDLAIWFLKRFLRASRWSDQNCQAELELANLLRGQGRFPQALHAAHAALRRKPQWPSACFSLAETYYCTKSWQHVIFWSERGLSLAPPSTACVVDPMEWRFNWIIHYTNALFQCGRLQDALQWTERALAICPRDPAHHANLQVLQQLTGRCESNG